MRSHWSTSSFIIQSIIESSSYIGKSSPTAKAAKTMNMYANHVSSDIMGDAEKEDQAVQNLMEESDTIIKELNILFPTSNGPVSALFGSVLKSGLDILKRKRGSGSQKQRDPNEIYRELNPKVQEVEKGLRETLASITERKSALQDQAKHLMNRLDACILYNVEKLQLLDNFIKDCHKVLSFLNEEYAKVLQMLEFNNELMIQNSSSTMGGSSQGKKSFSAWTYVLHKMKDRSSNSFGNNNQEESNERGDSDEIFLTYKHEKCKQCIELYETSLSRAQESKYNHSKNLDNCNEIRLQLVTIIRENESPGCPDSRLSSPTSLIHTNGEDDFLDDEPVNGNTFDHSNCQDCMHTYYMSNSCTQRLQTLDIQEGNISERLLTLIELREGLKGIFAINPTTSTSENSCISSLLLSNIYFAQEPILISISRGLANDD